MKSSALVFFGLVILCGGQWIERRFYNDGNCTGTFTQIQTVPMACHYDSGLQMYVSTICNGAVVGIVSTCTSSNCMTGCNVQSPAPCSPVLGGGSVSATCVSSLTPIPLGSYGYQDFTGYNNTFCKGSFGTQFIFGCQIAGSQSTFYSCTSTTSTYHSCSSQNCTNCQAFSPQPLGCSAGLLGLCNAVVVPTTATTQPPTTVTTQQQATTQPYTSTQATTQASPSSTATNNGVTQTSSYTGNIGTTATTLPVPHNSANKIYMECLTFLLFIYFTL